MQRQSVQPVTSGPQFVSVAAAQGSAAANALQRAERRLDYAALPRVTFTSPADGPAIEVTVLGGVRSWIPAGRSSSRGAPPAAGPAAARWRSCAPTPPSTPAPGPRAWLARHGGLDAEILDQRTAVERGLNFAGLLTGPA